jgi:galactose mutarotase-like enzyme
MENTQVYSLQNSELAIKVIPAEGGRISSLKSLKSGIEFLTQSQRIGPYPEAGLQTQFRDGACAGIEECLPTVGPSGPETDGGPAPDHGDFWQLPWQILTASRSEIAMSAVGFSRPLKFQKRLALNGNILRVSYLAENFGTGPQSFLYACHPLFAVEAEDRIILPDEVHELTLDYSRNARLGQPGSMITWPVAKSGHHLDVAFGPETATAEMFYTSRLNQGTCGIYRKASGQILEVLFDTHRLPYLGIWLCYGGWPDGSTGPLQYAVALEPATAPCNTLAKAQETNTAIILKPGESFDWEITFKVREPEGA